MLSLDTWSIWEVESMCFYVLFQRCAALFNSFVADAEFPGEQLPYIFCGHGASGGASSRDSLRSRSSHGMALMCLFVLLFTRGGFFNSVFVSTEHLGELLRCIFCGCGVFGGTAPIHSSQTQSMWGSSFDELFAGAMHPWKHFPYIFRGCEASGEQSRYIFTCFCTHGAAPSMHFLQTRSLGGSTFDALLAGVKRPGERDKLLQTESIRRSSFDVCCFRVRSIGGTSFDQFSAGAEHLREQFRYMFACAEQSGEPASMHFFGLRSLWGPALIHCLGFWR